MQRLTIFLTWLTCGLLAGCASFDHLTRLPAPGDPGPTAIECSGCHGDQYREWRNTVHARSFTSTTFREAAGKPPEEACLHCHSPIGAGTKSLGSRTFNQEEGVTCVSCHLVEGTMRGPHPSTALVSPHRMQADQATYTSTIICAACHGETNEQWLKAAARQKAPTCQECHQAPVERTATQGTNLFSNILVAFEKKMPARSHDINLEHMASIPDGIVLSVAPLSSSPQEVLWEVTVRNNLPHDLPTGTYGNKEIRLVPVAENGGQRLAGRSVLIGNSSQALSAGEEKKITVRLTKTELLSGPLRVDLERHSESHQERNPLQLASVPLPSNRETLP